MLVGMPVIVEGGLAWSKYLGVFLMSIFKYLFAVAMTYAAQFTFWEIIFTACLGSLIGIVMFTYFGALIRSWVTNNFKRKKSLKFSHRRVIVKIWKKFGVAGVAFLAPFISPPVSVAIALSFGTPPRQVIMAVSTSVIIWSLFFATFRGAISQWTGW